MSNDAISKEVRDFIISNIDSVEQIEVLLLMREQRDRQWTAATVSKDLRSAPESVAKRLSDLAAKKILKQIEGGDGTYQYAPQSLQLEHCIDALADAYRTHRITIINLIFSKPADAIRSFADAFRIKKDEDNNG